MTRVREVLMFMTLGAERLVHSVLFQENAENQPGLVLGLKSQLCKRRPEDLCFEEEIRDKRAMVITSLKSVCSVV